MAKTATRKPTALDTSLQAAHDNARQLGTVLAHQQQSQYPADMGTPASRPPIVRGITDAEENDIYDAYHLAKLLGDLAEGRPGETATLDKESVAIVMGMITKKLRIKLLFSTT